MANCFMLYKVLPFVKTVTSLKNLQLRFCANSLVFIFILFLHFHLLTTQQLWKNAAREGNEASASVSNEQIDLPIMNGVCAIPSMNPCVPLAKCTPSIPLVGKAVCICPSGYEGDGHKPEQGGLGCVNIDECNVGLHDCDLRSQECIDTQGSYICNCKPGYTTAPNGKTCLDIDECQQPSLNTCDPAFTVCRNLEGSFRCDCIDPTQIIDDVSGRCRDMNECEDMNGAMNPCEQICINKIGGVSCDCRPGYQLLTNGMSCEDINECINPDLNICDPQGVISRCVNVMGSYNCECSLQLGYETAQDGRTCLNFNECKANPYICGGAFSCCKDLAPPERFACSTPAGDVGPSTFLNSVTNMPSLLRGFSAKNEVASLQGLQPGNHIERQLFSQGRNANTHETYAAHGTNGELSEPFYNAFPSSMQIPFGDDSNKYIFVADNLSIPEIEKLNSRRLLQDSKTAFASPQIPSEEFSSNHARALQSSVLSIFSPRVGNLVRDVASPKTSNYGAGWRLLGGTSCPPGYDLGFNLNKNKVRQYAVQTAKDVLEYGAVEQDGTRRAIRPEDFRQSVEENTSKFSNVFYSWSTELAPLVDLLSTGFDGFAPSPTDARSPHGSDNLKNNGSTNQLNPFSDPETIRKNEHWQFN